VELACKVCRACWGGIGLLSVEGELIEHLTYGIDNQTVLSLGYLPLTGEFNRIVLRQRGSIQLNRWLGVDDRDKRSAALPPLGSLLAVPLISAGLTRGILYLVRPPEKPAFGPEDEDKIEALGTWSDQGNLFEESHLLARLRLLNHVAQAAAGNLEASQILSVALRELERLIPLHIGVVWLLNENKETRRQGEGRDRFSLSPGLPVSRSPCLILCNSSDSYGERAGSLGLTLGLELPLDQTPFASCLNSGEGLYVDLSQPEQDAPGTDSVARTPLAKSLASRGAGSFFAVPLRGGEGVVGVLQSVCMRPTGFTSEQIQLLYLVADLLGPAIANCQLFSRLRAAYEELQLTHNQLIQAEKMRAIGEMAAGVAHDFNNSLCGVLGFLELALLDPALPAACRANLEASRTCALDAAQTVRRVQDFARWQRHQQAARFLDPNELVRQTTELTRYKWENQARIRETPITVEVQTEATGHVRGNDVELREVLTSLILNAVDAMPQGGTLAIRTWSTPAHVFLSIRDTGVGISAANRRRLFEPFFTTKGERGNGLGLSVAFGIVQRHGGEIQVETEVGQGALFTVRLPKATAEAEPPTKTEERGATGTPQKPKSLRILVIEDEESIRRFLDVGLTQQGHHAVLTSNGEEGLAAFATERFDVVLTDMGLPGVSGKEVARTVTQRSPGTPVILLTGWADQIQAEATALEGVTRILGKPVTLSVLANTLQAVCQP
jgi:signal transduction histidine kinase/CheY-like chemotaxis protein